MDVTDHFEGTYGTMYYVRDMAKAVALYRDRFGFEPRYESGEWTEFAPKGDHALCLHRADPSMATLPGGVLIFKVTGLEALVQRLTEAGLTFPKPPHEVHAGIHTVDFVDMDGNLVSLYGPL